MRILNYLFSKNKISVFFLPVLFWIPLFTCAQFSETKSFELADIDMLSSAVYLPSGNEILATDNTGTLYKINTTDGSFSLKKFIATPDPYMKNSAVLILAVSPKGDLAAIAERQWNGASPSQLHIISTTDGEKKYSIKEVSNYYFKYGLEEMDLTCPGVADPNVKEHTCLMNPYYAKFTESGNLLTAWDNYAGTYGLFDRSFKIYKTGDYSKLLEWQIVSDNNPQERAGFFHSLPPPVIAEFGENKFIYGDCDFDLRALNKSMIDIANKKINVATQKPGQIFQKNPLDVNAGISNIEVIDGKAFVFGYESGGNGYFAVYNIQPKKLITPWITVSSADKMAVSVTGKWAALYGSNNYIYDVSSGKQEFEIERCNFIDFNPANENEFFSVYGSILKIYTLR